MAPPDWPQFKAWRCLRNPGRFIIDVFSGADIDLSNHAVGRLKDPRTKKIGFETPNDIAQIFNKGTKFDAGDGAIGYAYKDLEAIVNPVTNKVVTFRPAKKRDSK